MTKKIVGDVQRFLLAAKVLGGVSATDKTRQTGKYNHASTPLIDWSILIFA